MYARVCNRPDLAFVISVLSKFRSDVGNAHWNAVKKVF